jgi:uncharacterized protein YbjT (DUF2867 family)
MTRVLKLAVLAVLAVVIGGCGSTSHTGLSPADERLFLVTGATGTQGGAVVRELLSRGFKVRGLTRNPGKPRAVVLSRLGVEMVQGDYDDAESLHRAMQNVYGVFAVTDFWEHGFEQEVAHGKQLVDAAEAAGIAHFVYSSVAGADTAPGVAHFASKLLVEQYLKASGLAFSVVRPVEFMDNWRFQREELESGLFVDPRRADRKHQWIAASDIGFFVAEAFSHPNEWKGRTEEIAGDEMALDELRALFSKALEIEIEYRTLSWLDFFAESGEEMGAMLLWFDTDGYSVDVEGLRRQYPALTRAEEFIDSRDW